MTTKSKTTKTTKATRTVKTPKVDRAVSQRVIESWANKKTAKARSTRTAVKVGREEFGSFLAAIVAKHLDPTNHRAYRIELKRTGKVEFRGVVFRVAA
jgi:hypothetical protein